MNYSKTPVAELRALAAEKGIVNASEMKKKDLAQLLEKIDLMMQSKEESKSEAESKSEVREKSETSSKAEVSEKSKASEKKQAAERDDSKKVSVKHESNKRASEKREPSKQNLPKQGKAKISASSEDTDKEQKNENAYEKDSEDVKMNAYSSAEETKKNVYSAAEETKKNTYSTAEEAKKNVYSAPEPDQYADDDTDIPEKDYISDGILEILPEGYGFLRSDNYMPGARDIYLAPTQIRKFRLKTGDVVSGPVKKNNSANDKYSGLLYIDKVNGISPEEVRNRIPFEDLTPIFPDERIHLDYDNAPRAIRIVDFFSPIGKGQRGMIVSPPKAGKTTLLKQIAKRITTAYPNMHLLVLLIDERPEEVTDIKEAIEAPNAEVIYSTFDELPEHHKRVSEMVIERAKRLVELKKDVVILIDSITRLARAYNLTVTASGRTLSGGLDPAALHMPKKFFGAARNMREGGSLTILATALIETGSRMDDVVFEEFKGTGNMELVLDRSLSEKRIFPAISIPKSGTRRDDLLLDPDEKEALDLIHSNFRGNRTDEIVEELIKLFSQTKNNKEFIEMVKKIFKKY